MGVNQSPDITQEILEKVLKDITGNLEVCIDDVAVFSKDWSSHKKVLDKKCNRPQEKGFSVNPLKCEFGFKEFDFLGHWFTPTGVKPPSQEDSRHFGHGNPRRFGTASFLSGHGNLIS